MAESKVSEPIPRISVTPNLPVSNTGRVGLRFVPRDGKDILVQVGQSALLYPSDYEVLPIVSFPPHAGIGPVILPIAEISYDYHLQYFTVKALRGGPNTQFSVLVNLTDLAPNAVQPEGA